MTPMQARKVGMCKVIRLLDMLPALPRSFFAANRPHSQTGCPGSRHPAVAAESRHHAMKAEIAPMPSATFSILAAAANGSAEAPPAWMQFMPLVAMAVIFWFLILRPQMKRQKDIQTKIGGIKKGDQVVTAGGLIGKVIKVDDNYVDLELGPNVKVKAVRSTIADVVSPQGSAPAND
jgi:preprotein translocase subunit YajC